MPRAWPEPVAPVCLDLFLHPARIRHSRDAAVGLSRCRQARHQRRIGIGGMARMGVLPILVVLVPLTVSSQIPLTWGQGFRIECFLIPFYSMKGYVYLLRR